MQFRIEESNRLEELDICRLVLESLTPGGYYHSKPEECAQFIKDQLYKQHRLILRLQYSLDTILTGPRRRPRAGSRTQQ